MLSFWESRSFLEYDLIVIGGGIVGLSTAIQFKKNNPLASVLVLERGIFPSGASTRNAGFACFGSLTEIIDDLRTLTVQEVKDLVEKRYRGLLSIRSIFGDEELGYKANGGFELITSQEEKCLEKIEYINTLLYPVFGRDVYALEEDPGRFGFSPEVVAVVSNPLEGELDSGKFLNQLWETCQLFKIKILTGSEVMELDEGNNTVFVNSPVYQSKVQFKGAKIAVCTNAFTSKIVKDKDIQPGRGMIMVSSPLKKTIPWKGAFHYDKGYVYFRNIENRLLIGGGRNLDFEVENTWDHGINPKLKTYLMDIVEKIILPGETMEVDMEWSGIMAFGPTKQPIVELLTKDLGIAVRLGGMGVAIGWQTATELVNLLEGQ